MPTDERPDTIAIEQPSDSKPEPHAKPKRRRASTRRRVREEQAPEEQTVKVNANFHLPLSQFAQLAEEQGAEDEAEDVEEFEEADSDADYHLLYGDGLSSLSVHAAETHGNPASIRAHLRQLSDAKAFRAKVWRVPESFARRNPLIQRKPSSTPGWAFQGEIAYDPETLDSDLLTLFADGFYFIEIRENGRYCSGMLTTIGNPTQPHNDAAAVPPPVIVQEPAAPPDPMRDATAQAKLMSGVVDAATRLLSAQAALTPAQPKQPTLKERLEEIEALRRMFAPAQPAQQPQPDPLEKLAAALESETLKRILGTIKSENPIAPPDTQTGFWDFAASAAEMLAPGLNQLLAGLGRMLLNNNPAPAPAPTAQPLRTATAALPTAAPPAPAVSDLPSDEGEGLDIRFILEDLAKQTPAEQTAERIKALLKNKPLFRPFLTQYLAKENAEIWETFIGLADGEEEAATLREALDACPWKDEWLNSLKAALNS